MTGEEWEKKIAEADAERHAAAMAFREAREAKERAEKKLAEVQRAAIADLRAQQKA